MCQFPVSWFVSLLLLHLLVSNWHALSIQLVEFVHSSHTSPEGGLHICEIKAFLFIFNEPGAPSFCQVCLPCAGQPSTLLLQQLLHPLPAALPALGVFCSQISSFHQLCAHADTADRNKWSGSGCLMSWCSFWISTACSKSWNAMQTCSRLTRWGCSQQKYSFSLLVVQPLCPRQVWGWNLWILPPTAMLILQLHFPARHEWFELIRVEQSASWAAVRLKMQYLTPPLTVFLSKGQDIAHLSGCLGFMMVLFVFKGQAVLNDTK